MFAVAFAMLITQNKCAFLSLVRQITVHFYLQVAELNDEANWRSGLKVRLMLRRVVYAQNYGSLLGSSIQFLKL